MASPQREGSLSPASPSSPFGTPRSSRVRASTISQQNGAAGSVRVRRMTRAASPSNDSMNLASAPGTVRTAPSPETSNQLSVPSTTMRPRSRTITAALQEEYESGSLSPTNSIARWGEGPALTRPRGQTISMAGRPRSSSSAAGSVQGVTEDGRHAHFAPALEPSVQIETSTTGRPRSDSRRSRGSSRGERDRPIGYPPISQALIEDEEDEAHHNALETDILDVLDPEVSTASALSNVAAAIAVPSLPHIPFFRKPVVNINDTPDGSTDELVKPVQPATTEEEEAHEEETFEAHVARLVRKKEEGIQWRKIGKGAWAFLKTPIGIFFFIYGILVVFWGAALVLRQ